MWFQKIFLVLFLELLWVKSAVNTDAAKDASGEDVDEEEVVGTEAPVRLTRLGGESDFSETHATELPSEGNRPTPETTPAQSPAKTKGRFKKISNSNTAASMAPKPSESEPAILLNKKIDVDAPQPPIERTVLSAPEMLDVVANLTADYDSGNFMNRLNETLKGKSVSFCDRDSVKKYLSGASTIERFELCLYVSIAAFVNLF